MDWARSHQGNTQYREDGWVHRLYRYWQRQSGNTKPPIANSCPYLRRALIYAPLYALRNLLMAGPRILGVRTPILLIALGLTALVVILWWLMGMESIGAAILALSLLLYALSGMTLSVYVIGYALDKLGLLDDDRIVIDWFENNPRGYEVAAAPWLLLFFPVIAIMAAAMVFLVLVIATLMHLFDGEELGLWGKLRRLLRHHPRRAPWLTVSRAGYWLGCVPLGIYVVHQQGASYILMLCIGLGVTAGTAALFGVYALFTAVIIPRQKAASERVIEARFAQNQVVRTRREAYFRMLFASPEFLAWLIDSDSMAATHFRNMATAADLGRLNTGSPMTDEEYSEFRQRMGWENLNILAQSYYSHTHEGARLPMDFDPNKSPGVFAHLWEFLKAVGTMIYALKIATVCKRVVIVPAKAADRPNHLADN